MVYKTPRWFQYIKIEKKLNHHGEYYLEDFQSREHYDKLEDKETYYYKNTDIYKGDFINSKPNGRGIFFFNSGNIDGNRYEGEIKNFYRNGKRFIFL